MKNIIYIYIINKKIWKYFIQILLKCWSVKPFWFSVVDFLLLLNRLVFENWFWLWLNRFVMDLSLVQLN